MSLYIGSFQIDLNYTCQGESVMAEEFLTLMADLDDDSQQTLSGW